MPNLAQILQDAINVAQAKKQARRLAVKNFKIADLLEANNDVAMDYEKFTCIQNMVDKIFMNQSEA